VLFVLSASAWGLRWSLAGHLPIFGTYESALSLSVAILGAAWLYEFKGRFELGVAPVAALVSAALLAHGLAYDSTPYALTISERSLAVDAHAIFAWAAFGVLSINAGLAFVTVIRRAKEATRWLTTTLKLGFFLHTLMMASGSFYKFLLFGKVWSFDPIETLGVVAWTAYGTLLHMVLLGGWRDRRLAGWCLFVFVLLIVSYRAIVYFPAWSTYHILDMDLRIHVPG